MPVVTEQPIKAYAHCVKPVCVGTFQEEVDAMRVETGYLFSDNGGDIPGIERSKVEARFLHDEDSTCPHCGSHRDLSLTPRPQYEALSGHPQDGLLGLARFDPGKTSTADDETRAEVEALRAQIAELTDLVTKREDGD